MFRAPKAVVIVPVDRGMALDSRFIERVLLTSGPILEELILVHEHPLDPSITAWVEQQKSIDGRIRVIRSLQQTGVVGSCNRGLIERRGDAVLLAADCEVGPDWLCELAEVAHSEERTACASPLTNVAGSCSVPELNQDASVESIDEERIRAACEGLPRWTNIPAASETCLYLRGNVLDAVGLLNEAIRDKHDAFNDWVVRAQSLGFVAKRANRVYARQWRARTERTHLATHSAGVNRQRDLEHFDHQLEAFDHSLDGHLAAHAVRLEATGRLRVAYDLRHLRGNRLGRGRMLYVWRKRLGNFRISI